MASVARFVAATVVALIAVTTAQAQSFGIAMSYPGPADQIGEHAIVPTGTVSYGGSGWYLEAVLVYTTDNQGASLCPTQTAYVSNNVWSANVYWDQYLPSGTWVTVRATAVYRTYGYPTQTQYRDVEVSFQYIP